MSSRSEDLPGGAVSGLQAPSGSLERSLELVRYLRIHCPWDRAQTPDSLIPHLLEESHEVVDAIREDNPEGLEGELGDLLLNLAFQLVLGEEAGHFTAGSVVNRLEAKMVRRHPRLFAQGEVQSQGAGEARGEREGWEALKARERGEGESALDGLARGLTPLLKAYRLQDRASGVGFDWPDPGGALEKVREELDEVRRALAEGRAEALRDEVGDLLFAVVNLARLGGVHPDAALHGANRKFGSRFRRLEEVARARGLPLPGASLDELDGIWDELKEEELPGDDD